MSLTFCKCGGMLVPSGKKSICRNCGKSNKSTSNATITSKKKENSETIIIENNAPDLPTTDNKCEKCNNMKAFYWLIQTRSSDEPPTQFFKCTKCKHVWREYK